jgi:hypothetical protein
MFSKLLVLIIFVAAFIVMFIEQKTSVEKFTGQPCNPFLGKQYYKATNTTPPPCVRTLDTYGEGGGNNGLDFKSSAGRWNSHWGWGTNHDWYIRSGSTSGKVIIQDKGGNASIGTNKTSEKVNLASNVGIHSRNTTGNLVFYDKDNQTAGSLKCKHNGGNTNMWVMLNDDDTNNKFVVRGGSRDKHWFYGNGTARHKKKMKVDSGGQICIGNTCLTQNHLKLLTGSKDFKLRKGTTSEYLVNDKRPLSSGGKMNIFQGKYHQKVRIKM